VLRYEDEPEGRIGRSQWESRNQPADTLYVGNLPYNAEAEEIRELFQPYGRVVDVRIRYRDDGTNAGYAHVQFEKLDDAIAAHASATEEPLYFLGRNVRVDYSSARFTATEPNNKLYFTEFHGDEADLRKATREFASSISGFYQFKDTATGVFNGAGFIEFMSVERATEALRQLQGMVLDDGKRLVLRYALKRPRRRDDDGQRGRRGDWGGSRQSELYQQNRRGDSRRFSREEK